MSKGKRKNNLVVPFVKWVGGKRQLLNDIKPFIPARITTYYEPFVGGGAVFFHLQPSRAIINDSNAELINLYQVIKNHPEELINDLGTHLNEADYFYQIRGLDRGDDYSRLNDIQKASRIIYLNKTCYNGLFRVNNSGEFNTPFGRYKNPNIINDVTIRAVSEYLNDNSITLLSGDYETALCGIGRNAFVYFDPPYDPVSDSASFTGYTKSGFNREEQIRLKSVCDRLHRQGVRFLLSNSSTAFVEDLYHDYQIIRVKAKRSINADAGGRGEINEVLIRNYK